MNPWVIGGGIAGGLTVLLAVFFFGYHQGGLASKLAADNDHVKQVSALADQYQVLMVEKQTKEAAYEKEVISLQAGRDAAPNLFVRLCTSAPTAHLPTAAEDGHNVPPSGGVLPAQHQSDSAGPDVGPALFALADYADQVVAKCRAQ
jgi:hypothetical protein